MKLLLATKRRLKTFFGTIDFKLSKYLMNNQKTFKNVRTTDKKKKKKRQFVTFSKVFYFKLRNIKKTLKHLKCHLSSTFFRNFTQFRTITGEIPVKM